MHKFASLFLIFLAALVSLARAQTDARITATWKVQKYDISATLPQSDTDRTMSVRARLDLKNVSPGAATTVTMRISQNAEIIAVKVGESTAEFTKGEEKAGSSTLQKIFVRIPSVPSGGTTSVTVDYRLTVKDNSGVAALSPSAAQFLPLSFWYPTPNSWFFARGADYAPFKVSVTAPGSTVVSSGSIAGGSFDQKFNGQPFFAAGDWDTVEAGGATVYFPKGGNANYSIRASELAGIAADARSFITKILGPISDVPLRIVASRRGSGFGGGGTIIIDESVFRRAKLDAQTVLSIADGVAKTWLGGAISVSGDGDGAIREGLARYFATQFIESKFGTNVADVERARQRSAYAGIVSRDAPISQVTALDDFYYSEVANKGAMIWRLLAKKVGENTFNAGLRSTVADGEVSLTEIRGAFAAEKDLLDYSFDQITDMNLQVGLPQQKGVSWRVALRNAGSVDATVSVVALTANGEPMVAQATIRPKSFGEVAFKTPNKITRVEVDAEKLYPQSDYSDDVAPREFTESDPLLAVKRLFDKQDFAGAERAASSVLRTLPRFDDVRILLARSYLALGRQADAEREFKAVVDEKVPSSQSLAWANVGLADIASRSGQNAQTEKYAAEAILADAEYGASLSARTLRSKLNTPAKVDDSITAFFGSFDRAAVANKKADLQALVAPGEVGRFASGIAGQTEQWKTQVVAVDNLDANTALVETHLTVKLLNREVEAGTAVYRLRRFGSGWKLAAVDIFEVR